MKFSRSLFMLSGMLLICANNVLAKHITGSHYVRQIQQVIRQINVDENSKLETILNQYYQYNLAQSPSNATYEGVNDYDDHWADLTPVAQNARNTSIQKTLEVLNKLNQKKLDTDHLLNLQLLSLLLNHQVEGLTFPQDLLPINQMGGIQRFIPSTLAMMPTRNHHDYENILARLKDMPRFIEEVRAELKEGLAQNITPPQITLRDVQRQIKTIIPDDIWQSPLLKAFSHFPDTIPDFEQKLLRAKAAKIYRSQLIPAWNKFLLYFEKEYLPNTRQTIALKDLPQGEDWYNWLVKGYTTTEMTPAQIHQIGLDEVKRIHAEMEDVIKKTDFSGTFDEFLQDLRTNPKFFYTDEQSLLMGYRNIGKIIDGQLPKFFSQLPRLPYGVEPIPDNEAKSQTTAYYSGGSLKAGRSGTFFANTYALDSRPKWEMKPLTLHEAVPGHHLQISLAHELDSLADFRKNADFTVFVEGWALYAEKLGYSMELYKDPYDQFGQLTFEMWRAVRLVVDTGIHAMGWSRQQAIDFFKQNSSKSLHDIEVEIDRYIVWPGQALAYKIGQLKISALKDKAKKQLGDKFDIREFHQKVLENGAIPLSTLQQKIDQWLLTKSIKTSK